MPQSFFYYKAYNTGQLTILQSMWYVVIHNYAEGVIGCAFSMTNNILHYLY